MWASKALAVLSIVAVIIAVRDYLKAKRRD